MLIDTHCHIHEDIFKLEINETLAKAETHDVYKLICVGTSIESSVQAVNFANKHHQAYASIGVHPHDTKDGWDGIRDILEGSVSSNYNGQIIHPESHLVAIGEIGLDYFYKNSPREVQIQALEGQINLAIAHDLPIIFHVREAFEDFWPIFDNFKGIRGEIHSFTDGQINMEEALKRGLYIGVNGISTFTRDEAQKKMFASIPLDRLLLETDAPFLTPIPFRGKINEPAYVRNIAEHHAMIRDINLEDIASATTSNAHALFAI